MAVATVRLLKWVGEPPMLLEDQWSVANWQYENRRPIALPGVCTLKIKRELLPGLSRDYVWGVRKNGRVKGATWMDMIQPVDAMDADLIMAQPHLADQFIDVTDHPDPEGAMHMPIIVYKDPNTGKYYRDR